jgi:hypothetical protein
VSDTPEDEANGEPAEAVHPPVDKERDGAAPESQAVEMSAPASASAEAKEPALEEPVMDPVSGRPVAVTQGGAAQAIASNGQEICPWCHRCKDPATMQSTKPWRIPGASAALRGRQRICPACLVKNAGVGIEVIDELGRLVPQPLSMEEPTVEGAPNPMKEGKLSMSDRVKKAMGKVIP